MRLHSIEQDGLTIDARLATEEELSDSAHINNIKNRYPGTILIFQTTPPRRLTRAYKYVQQGGIIGVVSLVDYFNIKAGNALEDAEIPHWFVKYGGLIYVALMESDIDNVVRLCAEQGLRSAICAFV